MILILKKGYKDYAKFVNYFKSLGLKYFVSTLDDQYIIKVSGDTFLVDDHYLASFDGVLKVVNLNPPYDLVRFKDKYLNVKVNDISIGHDSKFVIMGGPCSITSYSDLDKTIKNMNKVDIIRAGAYKLRKSPYNFCGLEAEGIDILCEVGKKYHKPIISEIVSENDLPLFERYVDIIQVGTRNMSNFSLLKALGKSSKPILLKRGLSSTIEEWLLAAEYIVKNGNKNVILCERGIRTYENMTRNTLDLSAVPLLRKLTNLPIVVDPSHATGRYDLVNEMTLAAIACGADGVILEVSDSIEGLRSDGVQTITCERYNSLLPKIKKVCEAVDRDF